MAESKIILPTICITNKCNSNCSYCFRKQIKNDDYSFDMVKYNNFINLLYEIYPNFEYCKLDLTGYGEPLLEYDLIKKIIYDAEDRSLSNKKIDVGFTTNGILLNEEKIKFFKEKSIYYGISLDGINFKENKNRFNSKDISKFKILIKNIKLIDKKYIGISTVITSNTKNIVRNYDFFIKHFNSVTMKIVRGFSCESKKMDKVNLLKKYKELLNKFIRKIDSNRIDYIIPIINDEDYFGKILKRVVLNIPVLSRCGAANSKIALDLNGDIYMCASAVGKCEYRIGLLSSGIDYKKRKVIIDNIINNKICIDCWARFICGGPCLVRLNYYNEDMNEICWLTKELIILAFEFKYILIKKYPEIFKKLISILMDKYYI